MLDKRHVPTLFELIISGWVAPGKDQSAWPGETSAFLGHWIALATLAHLQSK